MYQGVCTTAHTLRHVPDRFKRQEICNKEVEENLIFLVHVPDHFKTQEMCIKAVEAYPPFSAFVPDHFRTQEMYIKLVEEAAWQWCYVSNHFKTQEMCNKAVRAAPCLLNSVPDWFVTQGQIKLWHDDTYYCNDDRLIRWRNAYQKRKTQKAKIKEELMPIAWHPSRWWNWCMPEDEKSDTGALRA